MITALSPLDGRYHAHTLPLARFFSEGALIWYRALVEIEYLIAAARIKDVQKQFNIEPNDVAKLRTVYQTIDQEFLHAVKRAEEKTGHDIKALEYVLRVRLAVFGLNRWHPLLHFALTSEDVNNIAYTLAWKQARDLVYLPQLRRLIDQIKGLANAWSGIPLLARTHGQPATPTTLGKELAVYYARLSEAAEGLMNARLHGKLNGATGTYSAHMLAFPRVDWVSFSSAFITSLGLEPSLLTTQVNSYDALAANWHALARINTILADCAADIWLYLCNNVFVQRTKKDAIGSSTMPHKINPVDFENAEGNARLGITLLEHLARTVPVSRLQRDLSASTAIRHQGAAMAHSFIAVTKMSLGLSTLVPDAEALSQECGRHWEVLAEAVQTVFRLAGRADQYERVKHLFRGKYLDMDGYCSIIDALPIADVYKKTLRKLSPATYTGLAEQLAKHA